MSCYRSFILDYDINGSLTTIAGATNNFYLSNSNPCVATIIRGPVSPSPGLVVQFLPQGFKNIDVYSIKLIGTIQSNPSSTNNGVVDNWGVEVNAVGTYGEIGGIYSGPFGGPTNFAPTLQPIHIGLNNHNPLVEFASPIKSVTNISINRLLFSAHSLQTATDFSFLSNFALVVTYKFEGE
jgi:hypothetical protein